MRTIDPDPPLAHIESGHSPRMLNTEKRPFAMRKPYLRLERQVRSALRPMALAVGTSAPGQEESLAKRSLPVFERLLLIKRGCTAPRRRASPSKLYEK